jgi:hypothetical protein
MCSPQLAAGASFLGAFKLEERMNFRLLMGTVAVLAVTVLFTGLIYAANGDLIVNGNLGVGTTTPAAKAEINGNLKVDGITTVNGNLNVGGVMSAPTISVPNVIKKFYESAEQPITPGGFIQLAHGLGTAPMLVQVWLKCKTAELGYSVGDMLLATTAFEVPTNQGVGASVVVDAINLTIKYGNMGSVFCVINKTNGSAIPGTFVPSHWKAIFRAWAM